MSVRVTDLMGSARGQLRHEPIEKRIRATVGGEEVVDSTRALLVWEPRRIVPSFAVAIEEVAGELRPASLPAPQADAPILHPGIPFSVHSTEGESLDLQVAGETRSHAAFRPADPDLNGHVVLDFAGFDVWYEEDEEIFSHPRDPFHRVDVRRRIESALGGMGRVDKEILALRHCERLSADETAHEVGLDPIEIDRRYLRVLARLWRAVMEADGRAAQA